MSSGGLDAHSPPGRRDARLGRRRADTIAVGLRDHSTNTTCTLRESTAYDSAGAVKVTVLATLLWDAKKTREVGHR